MRYKRHPKMISRMVEKKVVVLNPEEGALFNLNETASRLWTYLWKSRSKNELKKYLLNSYQVDETEVEKDLARFLKKGLKEKIIK